MIRSLRNATFLALGLAALMAGTLTGGPPAAAGEDAAGAPWSRDEILAGLRSDEATRVAHAARQVATQGLRELQPDLVQCLRAALHRITEGRDPATSPTAAKDAWALLQVLLDALTHFETPVPHEVLVPCLGSHTDTAVLLLARGGRASVPGLRLAYERLNPRRWNEAWCTAGAALAVHDEARFTRRLVGEVQIVCQLMLTAPPPPGRNPSSARPPPSWRTWREERGVPEGFPPVATWELRHRGEDGCAPVSASLPMYACRALHAGTKLVTAGTEQDDVAPMQARLGWLQRPILGHAGVSRLTARHQYEGLYTGPTPFRRTYGPILERLHREWWATVSALVADGRLTAEEAGALHAPIRLRIPMFHPGMPSLPKPRARNPFAPRPRRAVGGY